MVQIPQQLKSLKQLRDSKIYTVYELDRRNAAIAEFMNLSMERHPQQGYKTYLINGRWYGARNIPYHKDWNYLLIVIKKISKMENHPNIWFTIVRLFDIPVNKSEADPDNILTVYNAVYNYIKHVS